MPAMSPVAGSALEPFLRMGRQYWLGKESATAWVVAALLLTVTLSHALLQLRLNLWLGEFFNAIGEHAAGRLWHDVALFVVLAVGLMATAAAQIWLKVRLQAQWRRWLTLRLLGHWLEHGHAYRLRFHDQKYDNPDYRIAEDVRLAVEAIVDFATGIVNSALILVMFLIVLWTLSQVGADAHPFFVPGYLAAVAVLYGVTSGALTHLLGRRLISLSERLHACEGDFRYNLVRVRDDAEEIALAQGENDERRALARVLDQLIGAWRRLAALQTRLAFLTNGFTVAAPVAPLLVATPQYLLGALSLGGLVQASQAFVQVHTALGFFSDNYTRISDCLASMRRIAAFERGIAETEQRHGAGDNRFIDLTHSADGALRFIQLSVATPEGSIIIADASSVVRSGERVLLVGESGVGKTTLFRAIAGLWPWGRGTIELPGGQRIMFVPRRPYLPPGSLKAALAYPEPSEHFSEKEMSDVLRRCGLGEYVGRLDESARWRDVMSETDLQRVSFVRILLQQPGWVLMDEATSELDEAAEAELMSIFNRELADRTVIGTGHRQSQAAFYSRSITLLASDTGAHLVREPPSKPVASPGILRQLLGHIGLQA